MNTMTKNKRNMILILISFCVGMLYFVPYIRFSFYDQTLAIYQINNTQMGILGSVYGTVAIAGYFVSGILANRFSPKRLLVVSCVASALLTLWLAVIPGFQMLVVIYALFSVFTIATLWSPYMVLLRNLGSEEEQGRLFGISDSLRNVFSAVAGYLFVWIFGLFANEVLGYQWMLYVSAGLYVVFAVFCWLVLPDQVSVQESTSSGTAPKEKGMLLRAFKIPGVWLMGIFIFCCYNAIVTQVNYLGTYGTQILGMESNVSSAFAILRSYIVPIIAGIVAGYLMDKTKSRPLSFAVLLVLLALACILTPKMEANQMLTLVFTMILSMLAMMVLATYWSVMGDCGIPMEYTAVASGIVSCIAYLPDAYVTVVIGNWLDQDPVSGFQRMFLWLVVWSMLAAVTAVVIYISNRKKAAKK